MPRENGVGLKLRRSAFCLKEKEKEQRANVKVNENVLIIAKVDRREPPLQSAIGAAQKGIKPTIARRKQSSPERGDGGDKLPVPLRQKHNKTTQNKQEQSR